MDNCPYCGSPITGVEYHYSSPNHYDGISEWWCQLCNIRWGRWSGRELKPGESEPRYGHPPKPKS